MDKPLVAIRTITYNHAPYIRQCLDGFIMQQTNFKFVAVVHDDCSTDGTTEILREYSMKYPDIIKAIFEEENQHSKPGNPLRKIMADAIDATGAKYIAMCEGDDYWTDPLKLQKQVDFLEAHPDVGLCYTDCDMYYEADKRWEKAILESKKENIDNSNPILSSGYLCNMTWVYRMSQYPKLPDLNFKVYDGALNLFYSFCIQSGVAFVPGGATGVYRRHEGSASCFSSTQKKKSLEYMKSNLKLRLYYADYFPEPQKTKKMLFSQALEDLFSLAVEFKDEETLSLYKMHLEDHIDVEELTKVFEDRIRARESSAYKIGTKILAPIKWVKSIIK